MKRFGGRAHGSRQPKESHASLSTGSHFHSHELQNPKDTAARLALGELRPAEGKPEGNLDSVCRDCILKEEGRKRGGRERKDDMLVYYRDVWSQQPLTVVSNSFSRKNVRESQNAFWTICLKDIFKQPIKMCISKGSLKTW